MNALLGLLVLAASLDSPLDDERVVVTGKTGSGVGAIYARGLYVDGARTDRGPFSQGGGEVALEFAALGFPTGLGGLFGVEGEFTLGLMRSEQYADGTLSDQRDEDDAADPAKMWLTTRLGLRWVICPKPLFVGESAFRLGLVGGLQLEGSGARSWTMAGAFTAGAQLAFGTEGFGATFAWLSIPPQGDEDRVLTRHQLSFDVGIGAFAVGARVQFDHLDARAMQGRPAYALDSRTFSLAVGYRLPQLKL